MFQLEEMLYNRQHAILTSFLDFKNTADDAKSASKQELPTTPTSEQTEVPKESASPERRKNINSKRRKSVHKNPKQRRVF